MHTYRLLSPETTWHRSSGTWTMFALSILIKVKAVVPFKLGNTSTSLASDIMLKI